MPIYLYECKQGHEFDEICSIASREEDKTCPTCNTNAAYKPSFKATFQYGKNYQSYSADTHRWNLRENKRLKTRGKSYA